ncbi:glycosyltransferase family 8 protein [Sphaerobolus stellatus SS14]|uniref:Glycosyltransferase family 8 protein n=1 Tax=Sphaerobolus stellatus (strain SS14) TaxID=990650 RepID=A0A0C9VGH6_SPHS4|nr:glycosyltransferase family 8 protein [Sphaerobolus stellatus SS14]KIJ46139.1 glycosyltransferase family 8 protein [Sphaerobolus stellatus SS14]
MPLYFLTGTKGLVRNNISAVPPSYEHDLPLSATPFNTGDHAIVSSIYTEDYMPAILILRHSLVAANATARTILMYILDGGSTRTLCPARAVGWTPHPVLFIPPPSSKILSQYYRHQYSKLSLWTLDRIGTKSLVYLDADNLIRRNFEELFALPFNLAAVPDVFQNTGSMIGFNAGVLS